MKDIALKQAYKTIDEVIQEIDLAEQSSMEIICSKLQAENHKSNSPVIAGIIAILKQWGKVPANEIKERALRL